MRSGAVHVRRGLTAPLPVDANDEIFTTRDSPSCGPLHPIGDLATWTRQRRAFWHEASGREAETEAGEDPGVLAKARKVVIWLGTSLDEQIAFASLPAMLRAAGAVPEQIDVVQFHRNQRGLEILDVGILSPEDLAGHPAPQTLSSDDLAELERTWNALVAPEPEALIAILKSDYAPLPLLKRALRSILNRYPKLASGLNDAEMSLLYWFRHGGPAVPRVMGKVLSEAYRESYSGQSHLDAFGDSWLFWRMLRLGAPGLREPALDIGGSRTEYRNTTAKLTPFGERVLDGRANFVDVNGIDDWVAGVHMQSAAGRVWFHERGRLVKRPNPAP